MTTRWAALGLFLCATSASALERPVRVAIADVQAQDARAKEAASLLTALLAGEVARGGRDVVASPDFAAKGVKPESLRPCPGAACASGAALLDADYVLLASTARLGRRFGLELKLVHAASSRVVAERTEVAAAEDIGAATLTGIQALFQGVPVNKLPVLSGDPLKTPKDPTKEPIGVLEPAPTPAPSGPANIPAYAAVGGGVVAGAVGAVLVSGALGFNTNKANLTFAEAQTARSAAQGQLVAGYVLVGAGIAGIGVGAWLFFAPKSPAVTLAPVQDGAVLSVSGRF